MPRAGHTDRPEEEFLEGSEASKNFKILEEGTSYELIADTFVSSNKLMIKSKFKEADTSPPGEICVAFGWIV